jgi:hypothetical protein
MDDDTLRRRSRSLAAAIEPVVGQVFFAREAHKAYEALGFAPSPGTFGNNVAAPDGPAYFTSRGSLLGQVEPHVVAAAFGVFKPEVVAPAVRYGWTLTDAPTIFAARRAGGVAQLIRICGPADKQVDAGRRTPRARGRRARRTRTPAVRGVAFALGRSERPVDAFVPSRRHVA